MPGKTKFTQEDLIETAFDLVRKYGWEGLSARAIAEKLGSSTMPIYSTLKSMNSLEEEVIRKAFSLLRESMHTRRTGDQWLDFALGYVLFARDERNLFRCIHQERYIHLHEKYCFPQFEKNSQTLGNYPAFKGMDEKNFEWIMHTSYFLVYGIASRLNLGLLDMPEDSLIQYLKDIQTTLLKGVKESRKSGKHLSHDYIPISKRKCERMTDDERL